MDQQMPTKNACPSQNSDTKPSVNPSTNPPPAVPGTEKNPTPEEININEFTKTDVNGRGDFESGDRNTSEWEVPGQDTDSALVNSAGRSVIDNPSRRWL